MRPYTTDSPEAAARLVALTMLSDGQLSRIELSTLDEVQASTQLGLDRASLRRVIHEVCEDLLDEAHLAWADTCRVTPHTLAGLMAEVNDPELRRTVLGLCVKLAAADGVIADGEEALLVAAVEHWGMHRDMFAPPQ